MSRGIIPNRKPPYQKFVPFFRKREPCASEGINHNFVARSRQAASLLFNPGIVRERIPHYHTNFLFFNHLVFHSIALCRPLTTSLIHVPSCILGEQALTPFFSFDLARSYFPKPY